MSDDNGRPAENGFELDGEFYRWALSDQGKDLMLIDRFTGMPVPEFFGIVQDGFDRGRGPVLLAMMATSIRAQNPDWSVERIVRIVQDLHLSEVAFIEGEVEDDSELPPAQAAPLRAAAAPESSPSTSGGSSSSSIPRGSSSSEMSFAARA